MAKPTLALFLFLFATIPVMGQAAYSNQEHKAEAAKIREAFALLNTSDRDWSIFVVSKSEWEAPLTRQQHVEFAGSCYTFLGNKTTYCAADWVKSADLMLLGWALAHERGHIDCRCTEEWKAEAFAARVLRK